MPVCEASSERNVLLCAIALVFFLSCAPAWAQQAISTPILSSAPNFRDVAGISASNGGTGFVNPTANNGWMRTGVFYRSSALTLSGADLATVSRFGIGRDIDLRTPAEIAAAPDVVPPGTTYTNVNIFGVQSPPPSPPGVPSQDAVLNTGQSGYRMFVTDPAMRAGFGAVLTTLAHDPGPDLFHCSDGKDRTGWTAALLETIAGVSPATLMKDYLASNSYRAGDINAQAAAILAVAPGLAGRNFNAMFGVDPSYLQAALDQAAASYGSMQAYLTQGLGLSQADIYVLRAKMVDYPVLPGQSALTGNAASGAAFLNALQNSPLSGHYTAYNYYLQSAVDQGSLGGVQTQAGGQVHADAAAYLLRQPQWIDEALAPYATAQGLGAGQSRVWLAGLGGEFWTQGRAGFAGSSEYSAGSVMGATYRPSDQASADIGVGYDWGSVASAGACATLNTVLATLGVRYGFTSLEAGPYLLARATAGWVDYQSRRELGAGLGTATGNSNGAVYSGLAGIGDVFRLARVTIAPQIGVRVAGENLGGFNESGSDLALNVHGLSNTSASLLAGLEIGFGGRQLGDWTVEPAVTLGYERVLGNSQVQSTGTLYGFSVAQNSAYDSRDLWKAGLGVTLTRGACSIKARGNAALGDEAKSGGFGGQLSIGYSF
ncbi:MAG: tyrosine-protein phosphatase [Desulfovibrionaceae bacterium]|nr:tyrosine-protein phosphatase [Desulfovibrionaceae bacterium]MBF0512732.1 tyrosine-protein phosphatase [Desulfovibrionaceae bacterium]